ncbi:LptA/OstA family protein [Undibacterium sp.]|uniref:LptA/OstA family protein n=1 Tax=Undibacterium sp. TaxID=1914977 RepID=UPI00374DB0D1
MNKVIALFVAAASGFAFISAVFAEKADLGKHTGITADTVNRSPGTMGIKERVTAIGHAKLTKGSFSASGDTIIVTTYDNGREEVSVLSPAGLATMRQKKEGSAAWTEGEARAIYFVMDNKTAVAELRDNAKIRHLNGGKVQEESIGDGIMYDIISESVTLREPRRTSRRPAVRLTWLPAYSTHPSFSASYA